MCFEKPPLWLLFETHVAFRFYSFLNKDRYKQKSLDSKESRLFPSVTPTGCEQVTEGYDAERARKSIMPRSAAT